jgi:hypothetical protein
MTKRLLDMQDFCDPDVAETARLLRSMPPAAPSEVMEKRVYSRLCTRPARGQRLLRLAVLVTALLISTTILCATLVRGWLARPDQDLARSTLTVPTARPTHPTAWRGQEAPVNPAPTGRISAASSATVEPASAVRVSSHRDRPRDRLAGKQQAVASADLGRSIEEAPAQDVAPAPPPPPPEEAALVMAALRSLRREHNPAQAGSLLQRYLTRFPQGVLTEEALAIGIEAAVARHDGASATALATQYLGRYPTGRFVGLARKTASARP